MYPNFDTEVVEAFGEFLGRVFGTSNSHSMPKNKQTCTSKDGDVSEANQQEDREDVSEVETRKGDDDEEQDKDEENDHHVTEGGGDTLMMATPTAHLATCTTPGACLANVAGSDLANPCTDLATSPSTHSVASSSSLFGLASFPTTNPSTSSNSESTVNIATIATLPGVQPANHSPPHIATSSVVSGTPNPTPVHTSYLSMSSGMLAPNSFMDLVNNEPFFAMFGAWNNPFLAMHSGMAFPDMQSGVQSFTPISMGGTFPTLNPNLNPTGTFGSAVPFSQTEFNFYEIGTMGNYPTKQLGNLLTTNHAPRPVQSPSSPPEPLSDIMSSVQLPQVLPPILPSVVNAPPSQLPTSADNDSAATSLGCSRRKAVPSQYADRDNAIGEENSDNTKNKGKRKVGHSDSESSGGKSTKVASPKNLNNEQGRQPKGWGRAP
ncbi:hypothetical protein V8E55_002693 [Tylopilus felleus]